MCVGGVPVSCLASNFSFSFFLHFVRREELRKNAIITVQKPPLAMECVYPTKNASTAAGGSNERLRTPYRAMNAGRSMDTHHLRGEMDSCFPVLIIQVVSKTNAVIQKKEIFHKLTLIVT